VVGRLNAVSENDRVIQRSAGDVLSGLRNLAQGRSRTVGDMNARHDACLRRSTTAAPVQAGASYGDSRSLDDRRGPSGSRFNFRPSDPGNRRGSRFEWGERFDPPRRVPRIRDVEGALHGDGRDDGDTGDRNSGSDHWADGKVRPIEAGIEVLTTEQLRVLAEVKSRQSRYL